MVECNFVQHEFIETYNPVKHAQLFIYYGVWPSEFGDVFIAMTDKGICHCSFLDPISFLDTVVLVKQEWSGHIFIQDNQKVAELMHELFNNGAYEDDTVSSAMQKYKLLLKGTEFQLMVWQVLLQIPFGEHVSYQQVADMLGRGTAVRAVSSAIAKNKISLFIPCHRVIKSSGAVHNYRWGVEHKKDLLRIEGCDLHSLSHA